MSVDTPDGAGGRDATAVTGRGHLVLVGMMGTGKTTVGRLVADRLGRPFLDTDAVIEARTGHTVREIFTMAGEAAFRAHETEALTEMLAEPTPSVIAAAGGIVLDPTNRRLLGEASRHGGLVVWLRADVSTLVTRVSRGTHRPLLEDDPAGALARLATIRDPLYDDVADLQINAEADVLDVVGQIVDAMAVHP